MHCADGSVISGGGVDATWRVWENVAFCRASKGRCLLKPKVNDSDVGFRLLGKVECSLKDSKRPVGQFRKI